MNTKLLALYGLKWHPFTTEVPTEAIHVPARLEHFCWRIEHGLIGEGGFAMIHGDPGTGKSVALRLLAERLARLPDLTVGAITHPQSNLADFYREMGDLFGVPLRPHNRWGGFKALRERWLTHMEASRRRCVLLIDEAQEMAVPALSELRLLAQARFDSQLLLYVVLAVLSIPLAATMVRRLHDVGRSGFFLVFLAVPFIGWLLLWYLSHGESRIGENKYGDPPWN